MYSRICGQFLTYPLDVNRRRMQLATADMGQKSPSRTYVLSPRHLLCVMPHLLCVMFHLLRWHDTAHKGIPVSFPPSSTYSTVVRHLIATEGLQGLLKGFSMNVIKGPITLSISMFTYDSLKDFIAKGEKAYRDEVSRRKARRLANHSVSKST